MILFVFSKRRRLVARNSAVILIFIPFTTYEKISVTKWAGRSSTNGFSGLLRNGPQDRRPLPSKWRPVGKKRVLSLLSFLSSEKVCGSAQYNVRKQFPRVRSTDRGRELGSLTWTKLIEWKEMKYFKITFSYRLTWQAFIYFIQYSRLKFTKEEQLISSKRKDFLCGTIYRDNTDDYCITSVNISLSSCSEHIFHQENRFIFR